MATSNELKRDIQVALVELRECEAALGRGETSDAAVEIRGTIAHLGALLYAAQQVRRA